MSSKKAETPTTLVELARGAWAEAVADFYHPPLPEPVIEHDQDVSSYFYIDPSTWTVYLNVAGLPPEMESGSVAQHLRSLSHHEIEHYLLCPYDGVTSGMMFAAAKKYVNDATAMFACNLFADLVVDSTLLRRYPMLTRRRITKSISHAAVRVSEHSPLWLLIIACYKEKWGFEVPPQVDIDGRTLTAAQEIVRVTDRYIPRERRWPFAVGKIAKILSEWMPRDDDQFAGCGLPADGQKDSKDGVLLPVDVDIMMGNPLEARNGDLARRCMDRDDAFQLEDEMERLAIEVVERDGNLNDLRIVFRLAGIGAKGRKWLRFWYRANVRTGLRIEVFEKRSSGMTPLTPQVWRLGDPVEELDIVQSLQAFPVLIPNMSTRRWLHSEGQGMEESIKVPDLLIVVDSSGSMTWSISKKKASGPYHSALLAAFAALDYIMRKGQQIAVINFSDDTRICTWTRDRRIAEDVLLSYQGGGTVAPIEDIESICAEADNPVLAFMITDAEIANWEKLMEMTRTLSKQGHHLYLFHVGARSTGRQDEVRVELEKAGASVFAISSPDDLVGLVVREVRTAYGVG